MEWNEFGSLDGIFVWSGPESGDLGFFRGLSFTLFGHDNCGVFILGVVGWLEAWVELCGLSGFPYLGMYFVRSTFDPGSGPGFMRALIISWDSCGGFEVLGVG